MKPRIQYDDVLPVTRGEPARVLIRNQGWMRTSRVVALWSHPSGMPLFETLNTIYAPPDTDAMPKESPVVDYLKTRA